MTALKQFQRLEASGLWRPTPQDQRREVIVSLGDATLTLTDTAGRVLAHWSIAAVRRADGPTTPAIFHPDGDPGETLELPDDETDMINGLDTLLKAIEKRRPHPGKLRLVMGLAIAGALIAGGTLWLPDALERYTTTVVPPVKRAEIGQTLLNRLTRVTGQPCRTPDGQRALTRLAQRLASDGPPPKLVVVPQGVSGTTHLPGDIIVLNRSVVEDHEDPDVAAGYVLAEQVRMGANDPLGDFLDHAGLVASLKLLTTGNLPDTVFAPYAEHLLTATKSNPDAEPLLAAFNAAGLRSSPYAYAIDITGETTLTLIEGDPFSGTASQEVLSDADWVRLQGICGG